MMMQLTSVNIATAQPIANAKASGMTGIFKLPQTAPVQIDYLGLEGDAIVDTENHGGFEQAVYVFGGADYEWWSRELGRALAPGTFGENLTISELESAPLQIGDWLNVGAVRLQITSPRIPCVTLAARMGDPQFIKRFRYAERPGVYCRVIEPGKVQAGDPVTLERYEGETITVGEMFRWWYEKPDAPALRRMIAAPVHEESQQWCRDQLAALEAAGEA